ncbi:MAG: type IV pilin-like G/H family protein [Microcoleus sp.]
MQLKKKPQLDPINQEAEASETTCQPLKKPQSLARTLLKITFIYFPVGIALTTIALAFALPFVIGCGPAYKSKESEAKQYLSSINRAQQAYFAETGAFSNSVNALGIGIKTQTTNYNYSTHATKNAAFSYGVSRSETKNIHSYVAAVFLVPTNHVVSKAAKNEMTSVSIVCLANSPGDTQPANPILQKGVPVCGSGTDLLTK